MMSRLSPCKDCTKRYVGCHSKCADYLDYAAERKAISDARAKEQFEKSYHIEKSLKIRKKQHNRREEER